MLALSVVIISSCKKDDNLTPSNLAGTTWKSDDNENIIEFISKSQVNYYWTDYFGGSSDSVEENGIYTLTDNKIVIDFGYGDGDLMNGIIEGNSITFVYDGEIIIVKKQ